MAEELLLVLSTFPDVETARRIAHTLVEERLAACVNVLPQIESIYRWQGKVEQSAEALCLIKTSIGRYQGLEDRIKALHPYEVPEIIAINLASGLPAYLNWAVNACDGPGE
jgi:periplasmic divalent cation tolerance protein